MAHSREEIAAFQAEAAQRFAPSMRQRIDLDRLYAAALKQVGAADYGRPPAPWPAECPCSADQLLNDDVAVLGARMAAATHRVAGLGEALQVGPEADRPFAEGQGKGWVWTHVAAEMPPDRQRIAPWTVDRSASSRFALAPPGELFGAGCRRGGWAAQSLQSGYVLRRQAARAFAGLRQEGGESRAGWGLSFVKELDLSILRARRDTT